MITLYPTNISINIAIVINETPKNATLILYLTPTWPTSIFNPSSFAMSEREYINSRYLARGRCKGANLKFKISATTTKQTFEPRKPTKTAVNFAGSDAQKKKWNVWQ